MKTNITFTKCIQDIQEVGTTDGKDDRMVSRLFFTVTAQGKTHEMFVEIRQPHGYDFSRPDEIPIEVSTPQGAFAGPWHYESLNRAAEDYYRGLVGAMGSAIKMVSGVKQVRMHNNTMMATKKAEIEIPEKGSSAR